ncbi:MAG TPA: phosphopentomutase [Vicinamibacterales bacterium]|nr:phosphopentomutase [Vicinamibacterales bacterium]
MFNRAIVIVMDSVGIGELPDAPVYGDQGSDTLGNLARAVPLNIPTLAALGLSRIAPLQDVRVATRPRSAFGRMAERSAGKDSVTGHWELMGIVIDRPFPTFPEGFPIDLIAAFEARIGRPILGNIVASGTAVIDDLGPEHMRTGSPIVYTSADSVFQIAAHEDVVPIAQLYEWCRIAYELTVEGLGLGRVIARPFIGPVGAFKRTANRHDYAMPPRGETLLDKLAARSIPVTAIGKINDLFAGKGIGEAHSTVSDDDGMNKIEAQMTRQSAGLIFANLVDFDAVYGHRNDVVGYARNLEAFDRRLALLLPKLRPDDLLVITADHGNDPTTPSTDHSREHVPLLLTGKRVRHGVDVGTRETFADLGQTLASVFGVAPLKHGTSFLDAIRP